MARTSSLLRLCQCLGLLSLVAAQTPGTSVEVHPKLKTYRCSKEDGCVRRSSAVVLDDLSHTVHQKDNPSLGCGNWGSAPNVTVCPDEATCAKNCIVEGISNYTQHGVTTSGDSITLHQLAPDGSVASPRLYLLTENQKQYEMVKLLGQEFAFDVDMSKLPCGMNAALYMAEMDKTGGQNALNPGGAAYGTGYCDAQCYTYPFLNGVGNIAGKGSCCHEMDLWEANARAAAVTPHVCNHTGLYQCTGAECTFQGVCDQWGCGYNSYSVGVKKYYGPGGTVDSTKPFTVITQFPTDAQGNLKQINRLYVQDGKLISNAAINISTTPALPAGQNFLNDAYCTATGGGGRFEALGGMTDMGKALARGMVLIFTLWWDEGGYMNWLDSGNSGPCNTTEGNPAVVTKIEPDPRVTFGAIKWGDIGTTFKSG